jgi:putative transferase (TIGR04331 family)
MKKKKIVHITNLSSHIKSKKFDDFFLGKWCNLYSKNDKLFLNYKFKEKRNFKKIQKNNLFFLSRALNDYHKTNYSKNFWKILLYPWIYNFSYILSDRFDVIKKLKKINDIDNFLVTDDKPNIIFEDFLHHISNYQTDIFNNNIFKDLINLESNKKIKNFKTKKKISIKKNKKIIYRNYNKMFGFFSNKKIIFFDSGLSIKKNFSLHLKYHFFNNRVLIKKNKKVDLKFRKKISNIKILKNDFQTILNYMSLKYLPKSYLENFKTFILNSKFESLNKNPKIILTSHSHITDDMFKIWYAKICEKNKKVKLFVFQKGSEYFLKNESTRNLSYQILDKKLTWGSFMDKEKKNLCLGLNSNLNYDLKKRKKIKILYVCTEFPKYFFKNNSISHGPNFLDHILLHEKFFKNLNFKVIDKIDVKLYFDNFGWNISTRLKKINKKINFIKETDISKLYNLYDIVIPAGPSTTFLECIYLNIPVITLFERNVWQVNDKTNSFLNKLKKKRVYFDNPINASKYLNNNLDKIKINWYSKSTQSILNQFRKKFIVKNENFSSDLSKIIDN